MPQPIDTFQTNQHGNVLDPNNLIAGVGALTLPYDGVGAAITDSFLSAQAELLINRGCTTLNLQDSNAQFGKTSAGFYDPGAAGPPIVPPSMHLTADNPAIDIKRTASHEMTHGLEDRLQCRTEEKIELILRQHSADAAELFEAISSILPYGPSQIKEEFTKQIRDAGGVQEYAEIAKEVGAYVNESIFYEMNTTGKAANFRTRFDAIYKDSIDKQGSQKRRAGAIAIKEIAQEIVAVSISDINTRIIEHLEVRKGHNDKVLATELSAVNDHLFPSYERAEGKYNAQFAAIGTQLNSGAIRHRKVLAGDESNEQNLTSDHSVREDLQGIISSEKVKEFPEERGNITQISQASTPDIVEEREIITPSQSHAREEEKVAPVNIGCPWSHGHDPSWKFHRAL